MPTMREHEIDKILDFVEPWAGSRSAAQRWYESQALPSFDGKTPKELVEAGKADAVRRYLDRVAAGGYA